MWRWQGTQWSASFKNSPLTTIDLPMITELNGQEGIWMYFERPRTLRWLRFDLPSPSPTLMAFKHRWQIKNFFGLSSPGQIQSTHDFEIWGWNGNDWEVYRSTSPSLLPTYLRFNPLIEFDDRLGYWVKHDK